MERKKLPRDMTWSEIFRAGRLQHVRCASAGAD